MKDRRQANASRLREYMDAIKQAESMTTEQWIESQSKCDSGYIPKSTWISYLKDCALREATIIAGLRAA